MSVNPNLLKQATIADAKVDLGTVPVIPAALSAGTVGASKGKAKKRKKQAGFMPNTSQLLSGNQKLQTGTMADLATTGGVGGALVGALYGAINPADPDAKLRSALINALRFGATGAAAGSGAMLGGHLGASVGADIAGSAPTAYGPAPSRQALVGLGTAGLAGGASSALLAQKLLDSLGIKDEAPSKKRKKQAKVYEAAESVTDMPVKHVHESHKQCSPGEFGMNKEGESLRALVAQLAKQAADPRARMMSADGSPAIINKPLTEDGLKPWGRAVGFPGKGWPDLDDYNARLNVPVDVSAYPDGHNSAIGPTRKADAGEVLQILKDNPLVPLGTLNLPKTQLLPGHSRNPAAGFLSKKSAWNFGAHVKQALHPALGLAGLGGAGGLVAGGLSGLIAPGEYEDEEGNVKRRSRLSAALQRALAMGALGAAGGGAYGMYDQAGAGKAVDFARDLYQQLLGGKKPADSIRVDATMQADPGVKLPTLPKSDKTLLPSTGSAAPKAKMPAIGLGEFGNTAELFPGEQTQNSPGGTYSPTDEEYLRARSNEASGLNYSLRQSFRPPKYIDPMTGEIATPAQVSVNPLLPNMTPIQEIRQRGTGSEGER